MVGDCAYEEDVASFLRVLPVASDAGSRQEAGQLAWPGSVPDAMGAESLPSIDINTALRHGWLELCYQPKADLKRKCLAGAEANRSQGADAKQFCRRSSWTASAVADADGALSEPYL